MAYFISHTHDSSAYEGWIQQRLALPPSYTKASHNTFIFNQKSYEQDIIIRSMLLPSENLLYVKSVGGDYEDIEAVVTLRIDNEAKNVHLLSQGAATILRCHYDEETEFRQHGNDALWTFVDFMQFRGDSSLHTSVLPFFNGGQEYGEWELVIEDDNSEHPRSMELLSLCQKHFMQQHIPRHVYWRVLEYVADATPQREKASTLIAAAFRGWQARRAYRFNPYTCLGRHVALKMAGFV